MKILRSTYKYLSIISLIEAIKKMGRSSFDKKPARTPPSYSHCSKDNSHRMRKYRARRRVLNRIARASRAFNFRMA